MIHKNVETWERKNNFRGCTPKCCATCKHLDDYLYVCLLCREECEAFFYQRKEIIEPMYMICKRWEERA